MKALNRTSVAVGIFGGVLTACGGSSVASKVGTDGSVDGEAGTLAEEADGSGDASADASADGQAGEDASAVDASDADAGPLAIVDAPSADAADSQGPQCVSESVRVVSHWRGDGDFEDALGANGGYSGGSAGFAAGEVGQGFALTGGAGSFAVVPDSPTLGLNGALSIDAWVKPTVLGGRIVDKITAGGVDGYYLDTNAGKLRFGVGNDNVSSTASLTAGVFSHVAGVYDGANLTVYINGVVAGAKATTVTTTPTNTVPLHIGADSSGASLFTGIIDEPRLHKGALTGAEVQAAFTEGAAARCGCVPASPLIVSWWRGEGDLADVFLNNPATGAGAAGFGAGEIGQGFALTGGASSFLSVASSPTLSITGPITIDAWINPTVLTGRIVDKIAAGGVDGYYLDVNASKLRFGVGNDNVSSTTNLTTGVFSHVAGVYDGANLTVYVNGVVAGAKATTVTTTPTNALPLHIGADSTGATLFSGAIDEPRIYGGALSAGEIRTIYTGGASARCGCASPWPGLVSWWRGDGDFGDSAGPNVGVGAGAVAFASGKVGQAFSLTGGSSSFVSVASSPTLSITGPLTIDAWINPTVLSGRIVDKITAGGVDGYYLDTNAGKLRFGVGNDNLSSTATLPTGVFTHVAGVYDGANLTVYVNGSTAGAKATAVASTPANTVPLHIGADSTGASLFSGVIDEPRIFNRALSAGELKSIFEQGGIARCE